MDQKRLVQLANKYGYLFQKEYRNNKQQNEQDFVKQQTIISQTKQYIPQHPSSAAFQTISFKNRDDSYSSISGRRTTIFRQKQRLSSKNKQQNKMQQHKQNERMKSEQSKHNLSIDNNYKNYKTLDQDYDSSLKSKNREAEQLAAIHDNRNFSHRTSEGVSSFRRQIFPSKNTDRVSKRGQSQSSSLSKKRNKIFSQVQRRSPQKQLPQIAQRAKSFMKKRQIEIYVPSQENSQNASIQTPAIRSPSKEHQTPVHQLARIQQDEIHQPRLSQESSIKQRKIDIFTENTSILPSPQQLKRILSGINYSALRKQTRLAAKQQPQKRNQAQLSQRNQPFNPHQYKAHYSNVIVHPPIRYIDNRVPPKVQFLYQNSGIRQSNHHQPLYSVGSKIA